MGAGIESLCAFHAGERHVTEPTFEPSGVDATLRALLADVLGLGEERAAALTNASGLFGELPEFDSMAVATVLTEMEDRLGIIIDDDEIDGEIFETYGNLLAFSLRKVNG